MHRVRASLQGTLVALYPVGLWLGLRHLGVRFTGVFICVAMASVVALRFRHASGADRQAIVRVPLLIATLAAVASVFNSALVVLMVPALVNAMLAVLFAGSLRGSKVPLVERFARAELARKARTATADSNGAASAPSALSSPHLSAAQVAHCREATVAWVVFLLVNGTVCGVACMACFP